MSTNSLLQQNLLYRFALAAVIVAAAVPACSPAIAQETGKVNRYKVTQPHMGVAFTLLFYAPDKETANKAANAAFQRVAALNLALSDYNPDSELRQLCLHSGTDRFVKVSSDLWHVLREASKLSLRTEGAFDVTVGPYVGLWRKSRRSRKLPSAELLADCKQAVGYQKILFDNKQQAVKLTAKKMRLDLGGIAKGYAADEALRVLEKHGCRRALVDASGDVALGDPPPDRSGWKVAIAPLKVNEPPNEYLLLHNCAVATSGDAWQHVEIQGSRYSHIIDPRTGLGLTRSSSVTVVAPNCTSADSLASAVSVLGPQKGIALIDTVAGTATMIIQLENETPVRTASSLFDKLPRTNK